jgi:putative endonuclease
MNNFNHLKKGYKGEQIAVEFLKSKGYKIIQTRWIFKHKEIDIIAQKGQTLVIVEVKTRSNDYFSLPQDAVDEKKQKFLIEATEAFLENYNSYKEVRFDVIAIVLLNDFYKIEHIENAFIPSI